MNPLLTGSRLSRVLCFVLTCSSEERALALRASQDLELHGRPDCTHQIDFLHGRLWADNTQNAVTQCPEHKDPRVVPWWVLDQTQNPDLKI